ncbi:MAG TPA: hypothetical protein VFK40_10060 [Nitrososphaeraceae archaeon]|nr:hypothetical protein [Nitrososphaeraceae archaeon]
MKTPKWICNICKQTLTRKGNAKRHCDIKHDGISDSIVLFRDYLRLTTTTNTYPYLFNQSNSSTLNNNQTSYQNPFFQFKPSTFPNNVDFHHGHSLKEGNTTDDTTDNSTKREKLLSNILDKIAPKYEEIENMLSHLSQIEKKSFLGNIVCQAIISDNPIIIMNKWIRDLRKAKFHNVMLENASISLGRDKKTTKEYLKNLLKEDIID